MKNYQTVWKDIFGQVMLLHVHDLVDFNLTRRRKTSYASCKIYKRRKNLLLCEIKLNKDSNIGHTIPQKNKLEAGLYFIYESKKGL